MGSVPWEWGGRKKPDVTRIQTDPWIGVPLVSSDLLEQLLLFFCHIKVSNWILIIMLLFSKVRPPQTTQAFLV